jgi:hypothetical protein
MLDLPALTAQLVWVSRQRSKRPPRLVSAETRHPSFLLFHKSRRGYRIAFHSEALLSLLHPVFIIFE